MISFSWLIFAHAVGDMALQSELIWNYKSLYIAMMLAHSIIWGGCVGIALKYINRYKLWKIVFLLAGHYLIDTTSSYLYYEYDFRYETINFYDQLAHFGQLLMVYFL